MTIGRNSPCPCGSGKKYKRCCGTGSAEKTPVSAGGKFRFEPGSYGGRGAGYAPSILCQRQVSEAEWRDHFVLANSETACAEEVSAVGIAVADLEEAFAKKNDGGTDADLALCLKSKGYKSVSGFNIIKDKDTEGTAGYRR